MGHDQDVFSSPSLCVFRCLRLTFCVLSVLVALAGVAASSHAQDPDQPETPAVEPSTAPSDEPSTPSGEAAAADTPPSSEPADTVRGPHDPEELAAFIDGIMAIHLRDKHIAGATIVVVEDNKVLFSKGYGKADVAENVPVSAEKTMFRIGSVSKLLTWTAVMQLIEQGKLDLDVDVNTYLKHFKVPATYDKPVTLRHLLTHTPGFEDRVVGLFAHDSEKMTPLGELLARELPARVRAPGELSSYSNHGTALAGYIVAEVSGMSWEEYVEKHLLEPLGMTHTLVRQPAADKLPANMSKGYKFQGGRFVEEPFEYIPASPAGSISSSAEDMARFMIAHLQNGQYGDQRILQEETAKKMREPLFTHDERLDGMAYGFMRLNYNGEQIVEHGGDTLWFHSSLVLLPERGAGFFVAYNTNTGTVRRELFDAFFDRYYPAPTADEPQPLAGFSERAKRYTGSYASIRHVYSSFAKLGMLLNTADVSSDGDILLLDAGSEPTKRFVEVETDLFREIDGPEKLLFRPNDQGVMQVFINSVPVSALVALPWYETPTFTVLSLLACVFVCLSVVLGWPAVALIARDSQSSFQRPRTRGSRVATGLAWLGCLAVLMWLGMGVVPDPGDVVFGMPTEYDVLVLSTPVIAAIAGLVLLAALVAWKNGYWRVSGRLHYSLVALVLLGFVWFLYHWNLTPLTA